MQVIRKITNYKTRTLKFHLRNHENKQVTYSFKKCLRSICWRKQKKKREIDREKERLDINIESFCLFLTRIFHIELVHYRDVFLGNSIEEMNVAPKKHAKTIGIRAGGEDVLIDPEAVELGTERIGSGATCRVFKGKFSNSAGEVTEVACKEFMVSITPKHKFKLAREITCLKKLIHPNILQHFGVDFNRSLLVTELLEKQIEVDGEVVTVHNARELLDLHEVVPVSWITRIRIMQGLSCGLSFLHSKNVIHCDLKAANIFLGDNGEGGYLVKVGDFGTARFDFKQFSISVIPSATNTGNSAMCTAAYTAPELLERNARPSIESDIYSLGMVMAEFSLPNRSTPWEGEALNSTIIYDFVRRGQRPTISEEDLSGLSTDCSRQWMKLLQACWDQNPSKRPSSTEVDVQISSIASTEVGDSESNVQNLLQGNGKLSFVPLDNHQGTEIETMDEFVSSLTAHGGSISSDLSFDLESSLNANDGSNACVYLCTKIADELLEIPRVLDERIEVTLKRVAEETIRTLPKRINPYRNRADFVDVDEVLNKLNQHGIISTKYTVTELLEIQSSPTISDKKKYLKSALASMANSKSEEGNAFAIYLCHPVAILIGMLQSCLIVLDTHKVPKEVGGTESGLLVMADLDDNRKEKSFEEVVEWISLRMQASITKYATDVHSLVLLQTNNNGNGKEDDCITFDVEDIDLVNTSIEVERQLLSDKSMSTDPYEKQDLSVNATDVVTTDQDDITFPKVSRKSQQQSSVKMEPCVEPTNETVEPEESSSVPTSDETLTWVSPRLLKPPSKETELMWKGHLTSFGLASLKPFQMDAVNAVESGMDTVVIQPTGSGKSLCYQLPALIDSNLLTIVVCPTLSLINS